MTYRVLAIKWRPENFQQVIGQDHITRSLQNAIKHDRISHAFTFSGPRGVGKTTTARILAKELNNINDLDSSFDIIEMDAASNRGIDEIRSLRENVLIAPAHGKYKIYIIDEVHMLTKEAFNALLKTLEEPPSHIVFILATTDPYKMPATILSRTQRYDFRRLSIENITKQLKIILDTENIKYDEYSLQLIARKADGSMRDGLGYLDQVLNYSDGSILLKDVQNALGIINDKTYIKLLDGIYKNKVNDVISLINKSINSGTSIQDFISDFNIFLRNVLYSMINHGHIQINVIADWIVKNNKVSKMEIVRLMDILLQFEVRSKFSGQSNLALEVLMVKLCNLDSIVDISTILNETSNMEVHQNVITNQYKEDTKSTSGIDNLKSANKKDKIERPKINKKIISMLDKTMVKQKIVDIVGLIEKDNGKTAGFMSDIEVVSVDDNEIKIKINNLSNFIYETLLKDIDIIKNAFNLILDTKHNVVISKGSELIINKNKKDIEHPLFINILEKFDGQIIK